jgi:hypothetical protein
MLRTSEDFTAALAARETVILKVVLVNVKSMLLDIFTTSVNDRRTHYWNNVTRISPHRFIHPPWFENETLLLRLKGPLAKKKS